MGELLILLLPLSLVIVGLPPPSNSPVHGEKHVLGILTVKPPIAA